MARKIIIVSNDSNVSVFEKDVLTRHKSKLLEYIEMENLSFSGCENVAGHTLFLYITELGRLSFQIDIDGSIVFLPKELTVGQYEWWNKNKRRLRKEKILGIVDFTEDEYNNYDNSVLPGVNMFHKLRELIEEKQIIDVKKESNKEIVKCIKN